MAENNVQNFNTGNYQRENTNTNCLFLFSEDSIMLKIALYNDSLAIEFGIPEFNSTANKNQYPNDPQHRVSFILTPDRVATLLNILKEDIIPAVAENRPIASGITTNAMGTRVMDIMFDEAGNLMLRGFSNIDMNTRKAQISVYFPFNRVINVRSYNKDTGEFQSRETHGNFYLFIWVLTSYLTGIVSFPAHSIKKDYYFKNEVKRLQDIAMKLGIPVDTNKYNYGHNGNAFNSGSGNSTIAYPQTPSVGPQEVESIDKLLEDTI